VLKGSYRRPQIKSKEGLETVQKYRLAGCPGVVSKKLGAPRRAIARLLLLAAIAGCEPLPENVGLRIAQVMQSEYCGAEQPVAYVIEQESQWQSLQRGGERFLPDPAADSSDKQHYSELAEAGLLVVVAAGQRPSSGYRVAVDTYDWQRQLDELTLQVTLESPAADSLQATVLTSPCSVIAIRNHQGIQRLRFVGLNGDLSIQIATPVQP
jgi:hypothetical protein